MTRSCQGGHFVFAKNQYFNELDMSQDIYYSTQGCVETTVTTRIRVKLYAQKKLARMKTLLVLIFKCSSEDELLALLKTSSDEQLRFEFYYKSENFLHDCINPDGLCGPRNFNALQQGT